MTYSKDNLRQIFQQPFNQEGWLHMIQQNLPSKWFYNYR